MQPDKEPVAERPIPSLHSGQALNEVKDASALYPNSQAIVILSG